MALIKRNNNTEVKFDETADVTRKLTVQSPYKSNQRKTLKVDPPVYDLIKTLSYSTGIKMYDLIRVMANDYLDNELNERQKASVLSMLDK